MIQSEMMRTFWVHARKLNIKARQVLCMRLQGIGFRDIALALSISESSARVIYFRAKARILSEMEEWK